MSNQTINFSTNYTSAVRAEQYFKFSNYAFGFAPNEQVNSLRNLANLLAKSEFLQNRAFTSGSVATDIRKRTVLDAPSNELRALFSLDYASTDHDSSVCGPAAYFFDLARIVVSRIGIAGSDPKYSLFTRRPDLLDIPLDDEQTPTNMIPTLSLVNYVLSRCLLNDDPRILETQRAQETRMKYTDFMAYCENLALTEGLTNVTPDILHVPFDLSFDSKITTIEAMESSLYELNLNLMRAKSTYCCDYMVPLSVPLAKSFLKISDPVAQLLYRPNVCPFIQDGNNPNDAAETFAMDTLTFCKVTGISYEQLGGLLHVNEVKDDPIRSFISDFSPRSFAFNIGASPPLRLYVADNASKESMQYCTNARLVNLGLIAYLSKQLQFTPDEVELLLMLLQIRFSLTSAAIVEIAQVCRVLKELNLPFMSLLLLLMPVDASELSQKVMDSIRSPGVNDNFKVHWQLLPAYLQTLVAPVRTALVRAIRIVSSPTCISLPLASDLKEKLSSSLGEAHFRLYADQFLSSFMNVTGLSVEEIRLLYRNVDTETVSVDNIIKMAYNLGQMKAMYNRTVEELCNMVGCLHHTAGAGMPMLMNILSPTMKPVIPNTTASTLQYLLTNDDDQDLCIVNYSGTASGKVELHFFPSSTGYQVLAKTVMTSLDCIVSPVTCKFMFSQVNPRDLIAVRKKPNEAPVMIVCSAASQYSSLIEKMTAWPADSLDWIYFLDAADNLCAVNRAENRPKILTLASPYYQIPVNGFNNVELPITTIGPAVQFHWRRDSLYFFTKTATGNSLIVNAFDKRIVNATASFTAIRSITTGYSFTAADTFCLVGKNDELYVMEASSAQGTSGVNVNVIIVPVGYCDPANPNSLVYSTLYRPKFARSCQILLDLHRFNESLRSLNVNLDDLMFARFGIKTLDHDKKIEDIQQQLLQTFFSDLRDQVVAVTKGEKSTAKSDTLPDPVRSLSELLQGDTVRLTVEENVANLFGVDRQLIRRITNQLEDFGSALYKALIVDNGTESSKDASSFLLRIAVLIDIFKFHISVVQDRRNQFEAVVLELEAAVKEMADIWCSTPSQPVTNKTNNSPASQDLLDLRKDIDVFVEENRLPKAYFRVFDEIRAHLDCLTNEFGPVIDLSNDRDLSGVLDLTRFKAAMTNFYLLKSYEVDDIDILIQTLNLRLTYSPTLTVTHAMLDNFFILKKCDSIYGLADKTLLLTSLWGQITKQDDEVISTALGISIVDWGYLKEELDQFAISESKVVNSVHRLRRLAYVKELLTFLHGDVSILRNMFREMRVASRPEYFTTWRLIPDSTRDIAMIRWLPESNKINVNIYSRASNYATMTETYNMIIEHAGLERRFLFDINRNFYWIVPNRFPPGKGYIELHGLAANSSIGGGKYTEKNCHVLLPRSCPGSIQGEFSFGDNNNLYYARVETVNRVKQIAVSYFRKENNVYTEVTCSPTAPMPEEGPGELRLIVDYNCLFYFRVPDRSTSLTFRSVELTTGASNNTRTITATTPISSRTQILFNEGLPVRNQSDDFDEIVLIHPPGQNDYFGIDIYTSNETKKTFGTVVSSRITLTPPTTLPMSQVTSTHLSNIANQFNNDAFDLANRKFCERKRDVLVDAVLRTLRVKPGYDCFKLNNADKLSEYLLMDVSISGEDSITPIVQAHATLQWYLRRCVEGVERDSYQGLQMTVQVPQKWWSWIQNYRVWEANRKVLLYPENFLSPELRTNKSEQFDQLARSIQKAYLDDEAAETAFVNYSKELTVLQDLKVFAACAEPFPYDNPLLRKVHFFGSVKSSPPQLFHCTADQDFTTPEPYIITLMIPTSLKDIARVKTYASSSKAEVCILPARDNYSQSASRYTVTLNPVPTSDVKFLFNSSSTLCWIQPGADQKLMLYGLPGTASGVGIPINPTSFSFTSGDKSLFAFGNDDSLYYIRVEAAVGTRKRFAIRRFQQTNTSPPVFNEVSTVTSAMIPAEWDSQLRFSFFDTTLCYTAFTELGAATFYTFNLSSNEYETSRRIAFRRPLELEDQFIFTPSDGRTEAKLTLFSTLNYLPVVAWKSSASRASTVDYLLIPDGSGDIAIINGTRSGSNSVEVIILARETNYTSVAERYEVPVEVTGNEKFLFDCNRYFCWIRCVFGSTPKIEIRGVSVSRNPDGSAVFTAVYLQEDGKTPRVLNCTPLQGEKNWFAFESVNQLNYMREEGTASPKALVVRKFSVFAATFGQELSSATTISQEDNRVYMLQGGNVFSYLLPTATDDSNENPIENLTISVRNLTTNQTTERVARFEINYSPNARFLFNLPEVVLLQEKEHYGSTFTRIASVDPNYQITPFRAMNNLGCQAEIINFTSTAKLMSPALAEIAPPREEAIMTVFLLIPNDAWDMGRLRFANDSNWVELTIFYRRDRYGGFGETYLLSLAHSGDPKRFFFDAQANLRWIVANPTTGVWEVHGIQANANGNPRYYWFPMTPCPITGLTGTPPSTSNYLFGVGRQLMLFYVRMEANNTCSVTYYTLTNGSYVVSSTKQQTMGIAGSVLLFHHDLVMSFEVPSTATTTNADNVTISCGLYNPFNAATHSFQFDPIAPSLLTGTQFVYAGTSLLLFQKTSNNPNYPGGFSVKALSIRYPLTITTYVGLPDIIPATKANTHDVARIRSAPNWNWVEVSIFRNGNPPDTNQYSTLKESYLVRIDDEIDNPRTEDRYFLFDQNRNFRWIRIVASSQAWELRGLDAGSKYMRSMDPIKMVNDRGENWTGTDGTCKTFGFGSDGKLFYARIRVNPQRNAVVTRFELKQNATTRINEMKDSATMQGNFPNTTQILINNTATTALFATTVTNPTNTTTPQVQIAYSSFTFSNSAAGQARTLNLGATIVGNPYFVFVNSRVVLFQEAVGQRIDIKGLAEPANNNVKNVSGRIEPIPIYRLYVDSTYSMPMPYNTIYPFSSITSAFQQNSSGEYSDRFRNWTFWRKLPLQIPLTTLESTEFPVRAYFGQNRPYLFWVTETELKNSMSYTSGQATASVQDRKEYRLYSSFQQLDGMWQPPLEILLKDINKYLDDLKIGGPTKSVLAMFTADHTIRFDRIGSVASDGFQDPSPRVITSFDPRKLTFPATFQTFLMKVFSQAFDLTFLHSLDQNSLQDMEVDSLWGQYYWELLYFAPLTLANILQTTKNYDKAMQWYRCIFDPSRISQAKSPFAFSPLLSATGNDILNPLLNPVYLQDFHTHAFEAHRMARIRGALPYKKYVVMQFIRNLISWGDSLFTESTREAITEATGRYLAGYDLLGESPRKLYSIVYEMRQKNTLNDLFARLDADAASNAPQPAPPTAAVMIYPYNYTASSHFHVPENREFMQLWSDIADRLYKIRHCLSIEGLKVQLALFSPEIDPHRLVQAVASRGGEFVRDLLSTISGQKQSPYRFLAIIERVKEFAFHTQRFGESLLAALEKYDAAMLANLATVHARENWAENDSTRQWQLEVAQHNERQVRKRQESIRYRINHYNRALERNGALPEEIAAELFQAKSAVLGGLIHKVTSFAEATGTAPQAGSPFSLNYGGQQLKHNGKAVAEVLAGIQVGTDYIAGTLERAAERKLRFTENTLQKKLAEKELEESDIELAGAVVLRLMAQGDLEAHHNNHKRLEAFQNYQLTQFCNADLYNWMVSELSNLYSDSMQLAVQVAGQAIKAYEYELSMAAPVNLNSLWSSSRKGLIAGQKLTHQLNKLHQSYLENNNRLQEIEMVLSLKTMCDSQTPRVTWNEAVTKIGGDGFTFVLSENYFADFVRLKGIQKNYRIRMLSVEIPGTGTEKINLQLSDGIDSITITKRSASTGMFNSMFDDPRYLPFEGKIINENCRFTIASTSEAASNGTRYDFLKNTDIQLRVFFVVQPKFH